MRPLIAAIVLVSLFACSSLHAQGATELQKLEEQAAAGDGTAMTRLGVMYRDGDGKSVRMDYEQARRWFEKAASVGDAEALFQLGLLYYYGRGVKQDFAEAHRLYLKSAEAGNSKAMNNLGILYQNGEGVRKDYEQARRWYEKAASLGNGMAMSNLGLVYHYGRGVKRNAVEARRWYNMAIERGHEKAKGYLADLDGRASPSTKTGRSSTYTDEPTDGGAPQYRQYGPRGPAYCGPRPPGTPGC